MIWSVSSSKLFLQCQKKWYLQTIFSAKKPIDQLRIRAKFLKSLQTLYSWRGKLVDQDITKIIVPKLNHKEHINQTSVLNYTDKLIESQLDYAVKTQCNNESLETSADNYCAFFELEYEGIISGEELRKAKKAIHKSLKNLFNSRIIEMAKKGQLK